jgi:hypothetical protein
MSIKKIPVKTRVTIIYIFFMLLFSIYIVRTVSAYEVAEISNLSVGYTRNNSQITLSKIIPVGANHLFACGTITTSGSNYLRIILRNSNEEKYYGEDDSNKPFTRGYFCSEIMLNSPLRAGAYKIIITDSHKRVGELIFQVE